jgi:hypothetical protein
MSELKDLDVVDANNNDASFGFPENMNPSDVNDNMRAILGAIARDFNDRNGTLVSAGTAPTWTVAAPNVSLSTSYSDGQVFVFAAHEISGNSTTLNIESKGAKPVFKPGGATTVSSSDILANQLVAVAFDQTIDGWQMLSPIAWAVPFVGDVVGPGSATADSLARFDGTTGKLLKDGAVIGTDVQAYDADTLKSDTSDTLTVGMLGSSYSLGNLNGATTLSIANGNIQHATMTGSFTLTAPNDADDGYVEVEFTINATGGYTLTLSGFNEVSGTAVMTANTVNILRISKLNTNTYIEITQAV